ncbi:MAG: glycoside hydrolase family 5 protein [Terracidiphilus sp.]
MAQPSLPLHTAGRFIVDAGGNRVHLHAVNWYGAESGDFVVGGLAQAPLASIVSQIKSLGFNAVRMPWSNELYESNPAVASQLVAANPSLAGRSALEVLDEVVSALTDAGLMVILDNHNSNAEWCCGDDGNTLWYNSQYPESSWIADWQGMAARYADNPLVIGADLRNEPRVTATWGGAAATDWHAAAERGGNAVLGVNPHLLIFVEGVNYALDLSAAAAQPVALNVDHQLVYVAHDYGMDYSGLTGYNDWLGQVTPRWGYLVTQVSVAPLWVGEFGTCNSADSCVASSRAADNGYWFGFLASYLAANDLDWAYWPLNGTQSTGAGRTWGAPEAYGLLNPAWSGASLPSLAQTLTALASPGVSMGPGATVQIQAPGGSGSTALTVSPRNGFTGTVQLSCALKAEPSGAISPPTCTVPAQVSVTAAGAAQATLTIATTASGSALARPLKSSGWLAGPVLAGLLLLPCRLRRRRFAALLLAGVVLGWAAGGCGSGSGGGGGGGGNGGTTSGAYTFTVTATSTGTPAATARIAVSVL